MPPVSIVGGGIAGLSAALRLGERGFDVTLYEQNDFLGGKLGAHRDGDDYYEHAYHMYLGWYHNFWQIIDEVGAGDRFVARRSCGYIHRDRHNQVDNLTEYAVPSQAWRTIFGGPLPPADMFIWGYSLIDLLGTPVAFTGSLDRMSVHGFMSSRAYMTPAAAGLHGSLLAKAFAVPSYVTAARSYKSFVKYGTRLPDPMMWLLAGNTEQSLFTPIRAHIEARARQAGGRFTLCPLHRIVGFETSGKRIAALKIEELARSPSTRDDALEVKQHFSAPVERDLIVAVPPAALAALVTPDIYELAPELGRVRRLLSAPMPSLVIHFKRKLPNIPDEVVTLLGAEYGLTFLDLSQLWGLRTTVLNMVVSDASLLSVYLSASERAALEARPRARTAAVRAAEQKIIELVLAELRHYIVFDYDSQGKTDDIDRARCHLQTNIGEPLFVNQVGSGENRPGTATAIANLFLAGDFCRTAIDVVTIEGAVVSGLSAAETVRRRAGRGSPIRIVEPDSYPAALFAAIAMLGAPYAYAAKAWSLVSHELGWELDQLFPSD